MALVEELKNKSPQDHHARAETAQVGTISSATVKSEIGQMISEAMQKVGNEGVITVEEAKGIQTELDVVEGMQFDRGYVSPYFITNAEKMVADLDQPYILIHEKKLSGLQPMLPLLETVVQSGRPLLIIAEDVEGEALATLVVNKLRGGLKGRGREGAGLRRSPQGHAGRHRRPDRRPGDQRRPGHQAGERDARHARPRQEGADREGEHHDRRGCGRRAIRHQGPLQSDPAQIEETTSDYDREKLQERLAKLAGGVAVIRVGGSATEVEVKERKDRVDDALHATRAAVEEGIVPGGGVALARASVALLANVKADNDDQRFGIEIVRKAALTPLRQIAENAGEDGAVISGKVLENGDYNFGFDAQTGRVQGYGGGRHHRSDQGRAHGPAGRGLGRRPAGDHGSHDRREAGEEVRRRRHGRRRHGWRHGRRHGRHGFLIQASLTAR